MNVAILFDKYLSILITFKIIIPIIVIFLIEKVDSLQDSNIRSDLDTMAELTILLNTEIPEGRSNLADSHTNLGIYLKKIFFFKKNLST